MTSQQLREAHVLIFGYFMLPVNIAGADQKQKKGTEKFQSPLCISITIGLCLRPVVRMFSITQF